MRTDAFAEPVPGEHGARHGEDADRFVFGADPTRKQIAEALALPELPAAPRREPARGATNRSA